MEIIQSNYLGFCEGVDRAIRMAEKAAKQYGTVYTLGDIIHNRNVVERLAAIGVKNTSIQNLKAGDVAIIRSHGISKSEQRSIEEKGVLVLDATCPYVKKIHREVEKMSGEGYEILILGDPDHPEVLGTLGYAESATVFNRAEEIDFEKNDRFFLVVQTTYSEELADKIIAEVEKKAKKLSKSVVLFHSICYTTNKRQQEAVRVSKESDIVFVIGDKVSANTSKLVEIAKNYCSDVRLIEKVTDVKSVAISNFCKLGIISGASAPKELIMEVLHNMVDEESKMEVVMENVSTEQPAVETVKETEAEKEPTTMAEALKHMKAPRNYRPGHKLTVQVVEAEQTGISVIIMESTSKSDSGFIDKDEVELEGAYDPANYKPGMELQVVVIEGKQKGVNLSKKAFDAIKIDDEKVKGILAGEEFKLKIQSETKGGLLGKIGSYTVFVPASQIRMGYVKELSQYVGKELRLVALPPKVEEVKEGEKPRTPNPKRIVASQRIILEEEKAAKEDAFWEIMEVNNIIPGKVKRFTPFGAFVSVCGFDCLAHISDLAWHKIADPSEVLEINGVYDFVVLKVNREEGKVSLGYKQLQKKPYELAAEKYPIGTVIKGKVQRIFNFGAFIEIEPGIDGLVHVSQIGHKWIQNAAEALKVGDEVEAKIIGFENNKITLSIKELLPEEAMPELSEEAEGERPNRTSKFQKRMEAADNRGERRERRSKRSDDQSDEPREWVSTEGGATMAELFKGLNLEGLNLDEDKN